jgi:hypothetical protein
MENSESIKQIAIALLKAQSEMGNAKKDSNNPFFKSKYADLNSVREACIPALNNNKISVWQPTIHLDGKNFIKTILLHESGEFISGLTEIVYSKQNDAQAQGSGITYARRYGLQSLVNIGSEDDDGNKASEPEAKQDNKITEWLSEEQFNKAMTADKKGILATLKAYNGQNGKGMKKDYLTKLTAQLEVAQ